MLIGSLGTISNKETYVQDIQAYDENDVVIDLTGAIIVFEIRDKQSKVTTLSATTTNGKIVIATTTFTVTFSTTDTGTLCAKEYDVGCTITISSITTQLFVGSISVVDGIVS